MADKPGELAGTQRAAILLMSLSEQDAANVLKQLDAREVQKLGVAMAEKRFDGSMGLFPDGNGAGQRRSSFCCERHSSAAAVRRVRHDPHQPAAPQGFESRRQRSPIHRQQRRHCLHPRRFRPVQRYHERELPVGQADGAQRLVEAPCQRPCRSLYMQAETAIADQVRGL